MTTATDAPPPARRRPGSGCAPGLVQASILILRSPGAPTTSPDTNEMGTAMGTVPATPKRRTNRRIPLPTSRFTVLVTVVTRNLFHLRWVQWIQPAPGKIIKSRCGATTSRVGRRRLEPRTYGLRACEPYQWASVKYSVTKQFHATETHRDPPRLRQKGPPGHPPGVAQVRNADASTGACSMAYDQIKSGSMRW